MKSFLATRFTTLGRTKETHHVATELEEDVAYEFRVRACNAEGDGEPTTIAHRHCPDINKPPAKPGTPDVYDWDSDWAELRWAPPVADGGRLVIKLRNVRRTVLLNGSKSVKLRKLSSEHRT